MVRQKDDTAKKPAAKTFEEAMQALDQIVEQLEDGRLTLEASLQQYEVGVRYLKQCLQMIEKAEQRVALLTGVDAEGNPVMEAFEDAQDDLEAKAAARSQRRSSGTKLRRSEAESDSKLF